MVAAFDDVKKVRRFHFLPDVLKQIELAERIARSLHEQDWRRQIAQNFIPKPFWIAGAAERIPKTNQTGDRFFESNVATDPSPHAFPDKDYRFGLIRPRVAQRLTMRSDK
jgi:hypothetical protein